MRGAGQRCKLFLQPVAISDRDSKTHVLRGFIQHDRGLPDFAFHYIPDGDIKDQFLQKNNSLDWEWTGFFPGRRSHRQQADAIDAACREWTITGRCIAD